MAQRKPRPAPQHLISTAPRRGQCRTCAREVLTCHVMGEPTRLDTCHVNRRGEAMALVAGVATYAVSALGRGTASRRNCGMIRDGLPRYGYVHPRHDCRFDWSAPEYADGRHLFGLPYTGAVPPF